MGVWDSEFRKADVYIDFPYEDVMFRYEKKTAKVFRKFYGSDFEDEVPHDLNLYAEARCAGTQVTADVDRQGRPRGGTP